MQRRGFLGAILAAGFAPAAIGSGVLMPVRQIVRGLTLWGDGIHDDTLALQELIDGRPVMYGGVRYDGRSVGTIHLPAGSFLTSGVRLFGNGALLIRDMPTQGSPTMRIPGHNCWVENLAFSNASTAIHFGGKP